MAPKSVGPAPSGPNDIIRLQELTSLKGSTVTVQNVTTGSEARPTGFQLVIWLGGASRPTNMANGDIWFATEAQATPVAPSITTTTLNTMTNGTPFTQTLIVTGTTPMTFAVTAGTLPSWASLGASTGTISGTPNATGAYDFTITATNSVGSSTPRRYQGTVGAAGTAPNITTTTLPTMTQNSAYDSGALVATGSTPITYGVTAGTMPDGLSINTSTGAISGTPTGSGAYNFTVTATNAYGSDTQQFTGTIGAVVSSKSVFAAASPGTGTINSDGGGSLRTGNVFYATKSIRVLGVRIWNPSGDTGFLALAGTVYAYTGDWRGSAIANPTFASPQQSKAFSGTRTANTWTDVLFDTPITLNAIASGINSPDYVVLMVAYAGGNHYVTVPGIGVPAQVSSQDSGVFLAEEAFRRGIHNLGGSSPNFTYYGVDMLFEVV